MALIDTMKKVARQSQNASMPAAFPFGTVTAESPLTIRVDNRFDITGEAIVLMKEFKEGYYPTHQHSGFLSPAQTEEASGHAHVLKDDYLTNNDDESELYYGLKTGEKVVLLRNAGGQSFLVLGRV